MKLLKLLFLIYNFYFIYSQNNIIQIEEVNLPEIIQHKKFGLNNIRCNMVILLHLYSIELIDEFINQINGFMQNHYLNDYYIKINIPIADNINNYAIRPMTEDATRIDMKKFCPYHPELVSGNNEHKLQNIYYYIIQRINLPESNIQIMFSENRGQDVGGFFLMMDQLTKQNLKFDYLIKLHTKTSHAGWRRALTSFLNMHIYHILADYDCIFNSGALYPDPNFIGHEHYIDWIFNYFKKYPRINNFYFCAGSMFIVSSKFTDFMKEWDFLYLFSVLNKDKVPVGLEHAFERFFGYIFAYLKLRTLIFAYFPPFQQPYCFNY